MSTSSHFSVLSAQISSLSYLWIQKGRRYQSNVCRDVGTAIRLWPRSRGILAIVSPGGHILHWVPIWKSEAGVEVAFIFIQFLLMKLKDVDPTLWKNFYMFWNIKF